MIRILIADSVAMVDDSLKTLIQTYFGTMCDLIIAGNGLAAVQQSRALEPDIAVVDTGISGLTWIQTIREIRKEHPQTLFIITTAYSRYSYTNEAAVLDVSEILTKPISRKEVIEVFTRTIRQVELRRMTRSDVLFMRGKIERAIPFLEDAFIRNLIREEKGRNNRSYLKLLGVPQESGNVVTIEFGEKGKCPASMSFGTASEKISAYFLELRKIIVNQLPCLMSNVTGNRIVLYVPTDSKSSIYYHKEELIANLRKMVSRLEEEYGLRFRAGIGDTYKVEQGFFSFKESLQCLRQKNKNVVHIKDYIPEETNNSFPEDLFNKCIQSALKSDHDSSAQAIKDLCVRMEEAEYSKEEIEMILLKLMCVTEHKAAEAGLLRWERLRDVIDIARFRSPNSFHQMRRWYFEQWLSICDDIAAMRKQSAETVSGKAIRYIEDHFSEEISLEDVSRRVNISPFYFSRLFKQEIGKSFIEYLNDIRIQKAKEYLMDPLFSIKEICRRCGYSDPNYFSRIFRKYEGMSPSEWRNANS